MQKRLFVAISLPEGIKKRLFRFVEKEYRDLPVRWVREGNFHLTLNFLGYVPDENIGEICESVRQAAESCRSFELEFTKAEAGPNEENKKMIWLTGKANDELTDLRYRLEKTLGFQARKKKEFRPHITLGRIRKERWKKVAPEPTVDRDLQFLLPVDSVELLESRFEKGKRAYYVLESFSLK